MKGIIKVRAVVNPEAVGYGVLADVDIQAEPERVREVTELAAELHRVSYVASATGESEVSISLRLCSIEELFNFPNKKLRKIPGLSSTQSYILPFKFKDLDTWLPPNMLDA